MDFYIRIIKGTIIANCQKLVNGTVIYILRKSATCINLQKTAFYFRKKMRLYKYDSEQLQNTHKS